eukprot:5657855-Prymnesium_polylepis.1
MDCANKDIGAHFTSGFRMVLDRVEGVFNTVFGELLIVQGDFDRQGEIRVRRRYASYTLSVVEGCLKRWDVAELTSEAV